MALQIVRRLLLIVPVIFAVGLIRLVRPLILVRLGVMIGSRIGHFAGNVEIYLCEQDEGINRPNQRHVDIFFIGEKVACNQQLATMWRRVLRIWPAWIVAPIARVNQLLPGGAIHNIGSNTMHDQDVHSLLEKFPPHLQFSDAEIVAGEAGLRAMGIPVDAPFVCLIVRDSAYLAGEAWAYHSYRDSDVQNYVLAVEQLASCGYFVIRMGVKVHESIKSANPKVIDYATNGMRTDFMDVYLGAKCAFCISTSTGWDAIPMIFRRPIVYVNMMPVGYLFSARRVFLAITKHHHWSESDHELSLQEIFTNGVGYFHESSKFESQGIRLVENSDAEIRDVVMEMKERLDGTWQSDPEDEMLQLRFWKLFPSGAIHDLNGRPLSRDKRSLYGAAFLRSNRNWLQ